MAKKDTTPQTDKQKAKVEALCGRLPQLIGCNDPALLAAIKAGPKKE